MGKVKQRRKLHKPAKSAAEVKNNKNFQEAANTISQQPILFQPSEDLFAGLNINLNELKTNIPDDTRSVKSFKSLKSEPGSRKIMKKDKIKIRRDILHKKIDSFNRLKLETKQRQKRKNMPIIGDTNPLLDALPALDSLLKSKRDAETSAKKEFTRVKSKGTEKASKRKKNVTQGVKMFKELMSNKDFKKDPFKAVSQHIQAVIEHVSIKK